MASGPKEVRTAAFIRKLDACQRSEEARTYIFKGKEGMGLVFRYGALTGHRVAAIPSNFESMSASARKQYFDRLAPFRLVEQLPGDIPCKPA